MKLCLSFRHAAFPKGVWLFPQGTVLSPVWIRAGRCQCLSVRGTSLLSPAQPSISTVSTMTCMGQHRATQLSMVAWDSILHVAWGSPLHTLSPPAFPPNPAICLLHGFQPPGWAPKQHWDWQAMARAQCHMAELGHPAPAWAPQRPRDVVAFPHLCHHLRRPCAHPRARGALGQAWSAWFLRML